jgi:hypothetical protein
MISSMSTRCWSATAMNKPLIMCLVLSFPFTFVSADWWSETGDIPVVEDIDAGAMSETEDGIMENAVGPGQPQDPPYSVLQPNIIYDQYGSPYWYGMPYGYGPWFGYGYGGYIIVPAYSYRGGHNGHHGSFHGDGNGGHLRGGGHGHSGGSRR